MASSQRDPKPLVVRRDSVYYKNRGFGHHTCKTYRGDGITSGMHAKGEERKITWRREVMLD